MLSSTHALLDHLKLLRRAARAAGAELAFAGVTLEALLRRGSEHAVLHPQFLMAVDGAVRRTPVLHDGSEIFLGWLPYRSKHWPIAIDRLAFKRHAAAAGLPVAPFAGEEPTGPVVVRRATPSFEPFLRGPFRSVEEAAPDSSAGEFCEPYVEGDALTVWFWDGRPVCAEVAQVPVVVGDGEATLGDLVVREAGGTGSASAQELRARLQEGEDIARLSGESLRSVLPSGKRQVVGLGHDSRLEALRRRQLVVFGPNPEPPWAPVLRRAGEELIAAVPDEIRPATLFSVQATLDADGNPWLHDMDASPSVHPLAYGAMLETLLGPEPQAVAQPELQQ